MKRAIFSAIAAASFLISGPVAHAMNYVSAEGKWVWNPTESHYGTPTYAKEQTMLITRDDGKNYIFSQSVVLADGKKIEWGVDGKFDGKMHKGDWISMSFKRVAPNALSDNM